MTLPDSFLDELKARLGIAEVIGKSVKLTRRGRQFLGLCPFHGEKTPSFHVYEDHYHCFGCGAHGSVIDFFMQSEKMSFREAVESLAARAGMALPQVSPQAAARDRRRGSLLDVLEAATRYYQKMLRMPEGAAALAYLRERGVSQKAIDQFRLGYAPDGRYAAKGWLAREGFADELLLEAGLLIQSQDGSRGSYDRFRGRLMFPITDRRGRVVGFGARILGPGEPKYLNSPETPVFHKGRLLYNLAGGVKAARDKGTLVVVEGYMDVIGLSEAGWANVVAPLGTALTEDQLLMLWQVAPEPILLFDPDAAGERAAIRAAERALPMLKPGLGLRFAFSLTDTKEDPGDIARRGWKQTLNATFERTIALSDFVFWMETRGETIWTAEGCAAVEERLKLRANSIADPGVRAHFMRAFRDRVWRASRARKSGTRSADPLPAPVHRNISEIEPSSRAQAEVILIAIMLVHPTLFDEVEDALGQVEFSDRTLDRLRQEVIQALSGNAIRDRRTLAEALAARAMGDAVAEVLDGALVRSHRLIGPTATLPDLRDTWAENIAVLKPFTVKEQEGNARSGAGSLALLARRRSEVGDGAD